MTGFVQSMLGSEDEAEPLVLTMVLGVIDDGDEVGIGDGEDVTCNELVDDEETFGEVVDVDSSDEDAVESAQSDYHTVRVLPS